MLDLGFFRNFGFLLCFLGFPDWFGFWFWFFWLCTSSICLQDHRLDLSFDPTLLYWSWYACWFGFRVGYAFGLFHRLWWLNMIRVKIGSRFEIFRSLAGQNRRTVRPNRVGMSAGGESPVGLRASGFNTAPTPLGFTSITPTTFSNLASNIEKSKLPFELTDSFNKS